MQKLVKYDDMELISKYNKYYIRFWDAQMHRHPYDLEVSTKDADIIFTNKAMIRPVRDSYRNGLQWTDGILIDNYLKEYLENESEYTKEEISAIFELLNRYNDIKLELYESLIFEAFPLGKFIRVNGYSASHICWSQKKSMFDSYMELIRLRETQDMDYKKEGDFLTYSVTI